jgi:hypothetical protein
VSSNGDDDVAAYAKLPGGVELADVVEAIELSGYPFQASVAGIVHETTRDHGKLLSTCQEEWAFIDSDTGDIRFIDLLLNLTEYTAHDWRTGRPVCGDLTAAGVVATYGPSSINMLVECKQAELPYVFFLRDADPSERLQFPEIAGVRVEIDVYSLRSDGKLDTSPYVMSAHDIIGFHDLPYFSQPPKLAVSISKAAWTKGGKLQLSGEEPFRSLILPLFKAAKHFKNLNETDCDDDCRYIHFVVPLAVLRAPMLGSSLVDGRVELTPVAWVRVWRSEATNPGTTSWGELRSDVRYLDVVHESYLSEYLRSAMRDFGTVIDRLDGLYSVLSEGRGVDRGARQHKSSNEDHGFRGLTLGEKEYLEYEEELRGEC